MFGSKIKIDFLRLLYVFNVFYVIHEEAAIAKTFNKLVLFILRHYNVQLFRGKFEFEIGAKPL